MTEQAVNTPEAPAFLMLPEPVANPQAVIEEFFRQFHLHDIQEYFWEICKGALASPHYDSAFARSNLLFSAELIAQFFAAVQQIYAPHAGGNRELEDEVANEQQAQPSLEDVKEIQEQLKILTGFLSTHTLEEMEQDLGTWLKVALSSDNPAYQDGTERGNLIAMHDQLRALIRSMHQFSQSVNQEKPKQ